MSIAEKIISPALATMEPGESDPQWTRRARFVFIVGAPRSGTTWLQAMLASHPAVATGPETQFFKMMSAVEGAFSLNLPRPVGLNKYLSKDEFYSGITDWFHAIASKVPPPRGPLVYFLEKTPEHALAAPFILRCLPDARFIHLVRDGRHVAASLIRLEQRLGSKPDTACNATFAAQVWKQCVEAARNIPTLLSGKDHYREVRYEELRQAPREWLAELLAWLDLPTTDTDIEEMVARNDLETARRKKQFDSLAGPIAAGEKSAAAEPDGFFGKAAVDPHSFGLTRLQEYQCYRVCGPLLQDLGYCSPCPRIPLWARLACSWKLRKLVGLGPV